MIAVHKNQEQIGILLRLLDAEENDLYIHVDRKSQDIDMDVLKGCVRQGRIFFTERVSVEWARYSIVESTLIMLEEAVSHGPYAWYHLLSGQDLPLKPIKEINRYYDENDPSWNYLEFNETEEYRKKAVHRLNYYRFITDHEEGWVHTYHRIKKKVFNWFFMDNKDLRAGSAWFDINHAFAQAILDHRSWIEKHFKDTAFPDESFLQTMVVRLGLQDTCHDDMRFIDWIPGSAQPRIFTVDDYERLMKRG